MNIDIQRLRDIVESRPMDENDPLAAAYRERRLLAGDLLTLRLAQKPAPDTGAEQRAGDYEAGVLLLQINAIRLALGIECAPTNFAAILRGAKQMREDRDGYASEIADRDFVAPAFEENAMSSEASRQAAKLRAAPQPADDAREAEIEAAIADLKRVVSWRSQYQGVPENLYPEAIERLRTLMRTPSAPADARWAMLREALEAVECYWKAETTIDMEWFYERWPDSKDLSEAGELESWLQIKVRAALAASPAPATTKED